VERAGDGDDLVGAVTVRAPILAGQLDGAFVGLGAAIGEEDTVGRRALDEPLGQLELRLGVVQAGGVDQLLGLLGHGFDDDRVGVAQDVHSQAGDHVQVRPALVVVDVAALAALEDHGQPGERAHVVARLELAPVGAGGLHD
jgi:hypothetical protein